MKTENIIHLFNSWGDFIPQNFAEDCWDDWEGLPPEADKQCLLNGSDNNDNYWEIWDYILDCAYKELDGKKYRLHHDGDLWAISEAVVFDDCGAFYDAENNQYATKETIEWNYEKNEDFRELILHNEMLSLIDGLYNCLGDIITYNDGGHDKAARWASKNYNELEFCIEHNSGYFCDNSKLGKWVKASPSYIQRDSGCDSPLFDGIFVGTIGNLGEIGIQAENGDCFYDAPFCHDYFRIIARLKK